MWPSTKRDMELAAQLKAESVNWTGYNSDIVDKASKRLSELASDSDGDRKEHVNTFLAWFAGISAISFCVLGFGTLMWWSDFKTRSYDKYREELKSELSSQYIPVRSELLFEKDGLLYIKRN